MTADKPEDVPTTEETPHDDAIGSETRSDVGSDVGPGAGSSAGSDVGSELEPTSGREVGQGVEPTAPGGPTGPDATSVPEKTRGRKESPAVNRQTRISAAFVALAVGLVVLVLLLIFILQNNEPTVVRYFGAEGHLPLGVLLLFAAAGGALLVVVFGAARILQLHWLARRDRRSGKKP